MEDTASTAAVAAAMHAAMNDPGGTDNAHPVPQAEPSQAQESIPYGVADPERWPEPADPANPGGGIKP